MRKPSIKVCGLTLLNQVEELADSEVSFGGFIFYSPSSRYVEGKLDPTSIRSIQNLKKVGVFVNATKAYILEKAIEYGLDFVQLHGEESPEFCRDLQQEIAVIKAFKVQDKKDIRLTKAYEGTCDYFLFDTAGKLYGGNGILFNWKLLEAYRGATPFFLSGGIGLEEVPALHNFSHPRFFGVDVNSKFENAPGVKNLLKLKQFINELG